MTDFLTRLAQRTLGLAPVVEPLIAPRFAPDHQEPAPEEPAENTSSGLIPERRTEGGAETEPEPNAEPEAEAEPETEPELGAEPPPTEQAAAPGPRLSGKGAEPSRAEGESPGVVVPEVVRSAPPEGASSEAERPPDRWPEGTMPPPATDSGPSAQDASIRPPPSSALEGPGTGRRVENPVVSPPGPRHSPGRWEHGSGQGATVRQDSTLETVIPLPVPDEGGVPVLVPGFRPVREEPGSPPTLRRGGEEISLGSSAKHREAGGAERSPAEAPTVRISIGRVDVRAVLSERPRERAPAVRAPRLSLEEYLRSRNGEAR